MAVVLALSLAIVGRLHEISKPMCTSSSSDSYQSSWSMLYGTGWSCALCHLHACRYHDLLNLSRTEGCGA